MGLLDALNIGGSALLTHQAAIQITGNNVANAATPGYARQQAVLSPYGTSDFGGGLTAGGGVRLQDVRRLVDNALQQRLNDASSRMHQNQVADAALGRVESLMNEMNDEDLSSALVALFNSFSALAAEPEKPAPRDIVLARAQTVVDRIRFIGSGLTDIRASLTEQLTASVQDADRLASTIAGLNGQIGAIEGGGGSAASLRDRRDQALSELSTLIDVTSRENANGSVTVYIGSEQLVSGSVSRGLSMVLHETDGGGSMPMVSFTDNGGAVGLYGGQIAGLQATRDGHVAEIGQRFDALARELIWQVNRVHSSGRSMAGFTEVTGTYRVDDADAVLSSAATGLDYTAANGSFDVVVRTTATDGTVSEKVTQINVPLTGGAGDMTLNGLAAALSGVSGVAASVTADGALRLATTDPNTTLALGNDSSGVLAALGLNTLFDGSSSQSIALNEVVVADRRHIAAGLTGNPGDGDNAARLAALGEETPLAALNGRSLMGCHQELVADVAVWTAGARDAAAANEVVFQSLTAQRESLSGVSIDEEAVNLMQYQRAFQGASRFISVVNELLNELMNTL
ncbi:MAG: flagellar hook-associated protein FlgK [Planctomycetes bacterium]|nr:flagellar hook-associated protein FlgK [Planctomycetota bacterium]